MPDLFAVEKWRFTMKKKSYEKQFFLFCSSSKRIDDERKPICGGEKLKLFESFQVLHEVFQVYLVPNFEVKLLAGYQPSFTAPAIRLAVPPACSSAGSAMFIVIAVVRPCSLRIIAPYNQRKDDGEAMRSEYHSSFRFYFPLRSIFLSDTRDVSLD